VTESTQTASSHQRAAPIRSAGSVLGAKRHICAFIDERRARRTEGASTSAPPI
jgi:hypothetical protein